MSNSNAFYAANQKVLYYEVQAKRAAARELMIEMVKNGDVTAGDLRKHLAGKHKHVWSMVADFLPMLENMEKKA